MDHLYKQASKRIGPRDCKKLILCCVWASGQTLGTGRARTNQSHQIPWLFFPPPSDQLIRTLLKETLITLFFSLPQRRLTHFLLLCTRLLLSPPNHRRLPSLFPSHRCAISLKLQSCKHPNPFSINCHFLLISFPSTIPQNH